MTLPPRIRVLLVDDDQSVHTFVRLLLESDRPDGYTVESATSYAEGVRKLLASPYDVALIDYFLDAGTGAAMIRDARAAGCRTPMIIVTGSTESTIDRDAMTSGASDYIAKSELNSALLGRTLRYTVLQYQANALVRQREQFFHALLENSTEAVLLVDAEGIVRYASDSTRRVIGLPAADLLERPIWERVHPDDHPAMERAFQRVLETDGASFTAECRAQHADGAWRDYESIAVNRLRDPAVGGIAVTIRDVTARKQAESEHAYLAAIVRSSHAAILATDLENRIVSWSPGAERLYGYAAADILGQPLSVLIPEDQRAASDARLRRIWRGEHFDEYEAERIRKDGSRVEVSVTLSPVVGPSGRVSGISSMTQDVTERNRVLATLEEREHEYREMFDGNPVGSAQVDLDGRFIRVNERLCDILARPEDALLHVSLMEIFPLEPHVRQELLDNQRTHTVGEHPYLRPGGDLLWLLLRITLHRDADGRAMYFLAIVEDITAVRTAEEQQRRTLDQLKAVMANLPAAVWEVDQRLTITLAEGRLLDHVGLSSPDLIGAHVSRFATPESLSYIQRALNGETHRQVFSFADRLLETWYSPVSVDGTVKAVIGVSLDITEQTALEDQLRQSQKMDAIGRLAGGIAHDFNNLLTAILGFGELVRDRLIDDDTGRSNVDEVLEAGRSAAMLTAQLLAFGRRQTLQPQVLSLNEVLSRVKGLLERVIGEDISFSTALQPDLQLVNADPGQIEQVIMNLAVNARDAMPRGGRLTVTTANVVLDARDDVQRHGVDAGAYVALTVTDTGSGIPESVQRNIFEPFFTTKAPGKGTGLGLATVYGIVRQSGGFITVASEIDRGSTFKVFLPTVDAELTPTTDLDVPADVGGWETILIVEDQDAVRKVAHRTLTQHGYVVLVAGTASEALTLSRSYDGVIDLLFTDVVMPEIGGGDLARALTSERPSLRVLYMSGYTDDEVVNHGVFDRNIAFLQKPFTRTGLLNKVREVLDA